MHQQQTRLFFPLAIGMIVCLLLLINISFKVVEIQGFMFTTNCLICPVIALLYLKVLRDCTIVEQKNILNCCVMALYVFPLGIFFLINLPSAEYMHNNPAYHIVFEDIPKKFFAATLSFMLSIYLPHWIYRSKMQSLHSSLWIHWLLAMLGGISFFIMNYCLLFINLTFEVLPTEIFSNSIKICLMLQLGAGLVYLLHRFMNNHERKAPVIYEPKALHYYEWMVCTAVVIMLVCLVCEYRLVVFAKDWTVAASSLFFPLVVMISSLIGELYGYKANLRFTLILITTEVFFDSLLMGLVVLPSPEFFDINPFYSFIMPRRLPAASLALLGTFITNTILLEYLTHSPLSMPRSTRIVIANVCATSLLCLVNYSLLFGGIYAYDQVLNLTLNAWVCKIAAMLIALPGVLFLLHWMEKNINAHAAALKSHRQAYFERTTR